MWSLWWVCVIVISFSGSNWEAYVVFSAAKRALLQAWLSVVGRWLLIVSASVVFRFLVVFLLPISLKIMIFFFFLLKFFLGNKKWH